MDPSLLDVLQGLRSGFTRLSASSESAIAECEAALGLSLPTEYRAFLLWSDGGELSAGIQAVDFWGVGRLQRRYSALEVARYLPGAILVGSNEGETALGYKIGESGEIPLAVPFGDLSDDAIAWVGPTLGSLISRVISSEVDLDEICYPDSERA